MTGRDVDIVVADDPARVVAERLAQLAADGGSVVLTGGSTPRLAYEQAATLAPDWSRVEVYWGDERCVPPDDERSNYRLVRETLLDRLAAPPQVRRVQGELPPAEAAARYDAELDGVALDLVLLGIGEDGHTASLFPGSPALDERERRAVAGPAGLEPFVERVTLTLPAIAAAASVVFLVTGAGKAEAARRAFADGGVPASLARSAAGENIAILDRAAGSLLEV